MNIKILKLNKGERMRISTAEIKIMIKECIRIPGMYTATDFRNYINMNSQKEVTRGQISGAISQLIDSKEIIRVGRGLYSKDTQSIKKTTNDEAEDTLKNNIYNTLSKIEDELMNAIGAVNVWEVNSDNFAVITKMRELKDSIEEIKRQCQ